MSSNLIQISFEWPDQSGGLFFNEEFIIGGWHPTAEFKLKKLIPSSIYEKTSYIQKGNFFLLTSRFPFGLKDKSLAHQITYPVHRNEAIGLVAFRGYLLDPFIHSWSESELIINYWCQNHHHYNGVFVAICITEDGRELKFISDAFGLAPFYYREFAGGIIFSTNSRFLTTHNDQMDTIAASILMENRAVYSDHTLTKGLLRIPAGTILKFYKDKAYKNKWFSYSSLPTGDKPITYKKLRDIEDIFQNSLDRCIKLKAEGQVLPLSSGYDSRRILAGLHSRNVFFNALTVRVLQKEHRDLDGYWTSVMSEKLGFNHRVIDLPHPEKFASLDYIRRVVMDAQNCEHTWFLSMYEFLPTYSCLVFDGTGGDVFGNTGFGIKELYTIPDHYKLQKIVEMVIAGNLGNFLNSKRWPAIQTVRQELLSFLEDLPDGNNKSDLAFLLMRCRSGPGMCAQRLIPAGHIVVYPYFDLDYAFAALDFNPIEKLPPETLQARCLSEFWGPYYAFPGSRKIPLDSMPGNPDLAQKLWDSCFEQLKHETGFPFEKEFRSFITLTGFLKAVLARSNIGYARSAQWWLEPLLNLVSWHVNKRVCWSQD